MALVIFAILVMSVLVVTPDTRDCDSLRLILCLTRPGFYGNLLTINSLVQLRSCPGRTEGLY